MASVLPPELVAAVAEGRAVLFLGSGASKGAKNDKDQDIPLAAGLAEALVKEFLGPDYQGSDFRTAYDLSSSQRDVLTIQRFIFDLLSPFHPADFHCLVPKLAWAGLLTTNYDLIVERAYDKVQSPVQKLIPNDKDDDGATERLDHRSVLFVKLHGSITRYHEVHPPMVASSEQLISFREGRNGQFDTFLEWAKTKTIIFIGYSFLDANLRALFAEIIKEGDNRPRHYIINKGLRPAEQTYWADRRVTAISMSFEEFIRALDTDIPPGKRELGSLASRALHATSFTRFITVSGAHVSENLKSYLTSLIDHVTPALVAPADDPRRFYRGFDLEWFPIQAELDVTRAVTQEILSEQIIPAPPTERASLIVLKGHAGAGKSVTLRRLAWQAAASHDRLCLFVSRRGMIDVERFEEMFSLTKLPIYLFVDNLSDHKRRILELIRVVRRTRAALRIIGTERFNIWNTTCEDLEPLVSAEYQMRYLSESSIKELVAKLEAHGSLGYLERLPLQERYRELRQIHGRQLLVALLEATHGVPLIEIITNEYKSIYPPEARILYLDICCLHRYGPPVRAGLIARLHDISFEDFRERLFRPLEQIVHLRRDPRSGDYVYEARHPHIADVVYEAALTTRDERFDNLVRIVTKLNPAFSYDLEVLGRLIRADNIRNVVSDPNRGRQIYDAALKSAGHRTVILHQRGIYEMHVAGNFSELNRAEELLLEGLSIEPQNPTIKHSLAELDLRRSRVASDPLERQTWRRNAVSRANALVPNSTNSYPYSTLVKAAIDDVRDSLAAVETSDAEASVLRLGDSIVQAENVLRKGLQAFPNDEMLLVLEGELSSSLSQAERAEAAFKKAFKGNPHSTLIARRLARIQRAKGNYTEALETLRVSLDANASSRELNYDMAMTLLQSAPDADQSHTEDILYHLRRSFAPGDRNYETQFVFARELCIADRYDEAAPIFAKLSELKLPFREKTQLRGVVLDSNGQPLRLHGNVIARQSSYGFIQSDEPKLRVYFGASELGSSFDDVSEGAAVSFELAFNLRGPIAVHLSLVGK